MHHEEQFCEIILNLGQWFTRCHLKDFLSGALAVLLFGAAEPFMHVKLYGIWTSGSKDVCKDISYLEL